MSNQSIRHRNSRGFTLTELIIVIVILGIIAGVVAPLIGNKFFAVAQSTERAEWVQQAEYALFHMRQDLANSVPNTLWVNTGDQSVEYLGIDVRAPLYAARYRDRQLAGFDRLQPNNDSSFDLFGYYPNLSGTANYVSIGTTDSTSMRNDWQTNMASGTGTLAEITSSTANQTGSENGGPLSNVVLTAAHNFGGHSPYFRAYFFSGPQAYECDLSSGFLNRVTNYTNLAVGTGYAARTGSAVRQRVVSDIRDCEFEYLAGSTFEPPKLRVMLELGNAAESIRIIDVLQLSNGS